MPSLRIKCALYDLHGTTMLLCVCVSSRITNRDYSLFEHFHSINAEDVIFINIFSRQTFFNQKHINFLTTHLTIYPKDTTIQ